MRQGRSRVDLWGSEVDVSILVRELWVQKYVLFTAIALSSIVAIGYCLMAKPVFVSQMVISPGAIKYYGSIAGEVGRWEGQAAGSPLSIGAALRNDAFRLYLTRLESVQVRNSFNGQFAKGVVSVGLQVRRGPSAPFLDQSATVVAQSEDPEMAKEYLEAYVEYSADVAMTQVNEYFGNMGVPHLIAAEALFTVEQASVVSSSPIRPDRTVIIVMALFLGFIVGVFLVFIRILFRNKVYMTN